MTRPPFRAVPVLMFAAMGLMAAGTLAQVPTKGQTKPATKAQADRLDLNSATAEELETLPGIGPATSKKIIDGRPYKSVEGLKDAGVNDATLAKLRDAVAVNPPVDLNHAKAEELQTLPGVGPATAKAIMDARPFKRVDDLKTVKGVGEAKFAALRHRVKVGPVAEPKKAAPKGAAPSAGVAKKVNINKASLEELDSLLGIGPAKAQAIVEGRPYKTIDDLKKAKGIGEATYGTLKDRITVE